MNNNNYKTTSSSSSSSSPQQASNTKHLSSNPSSTTSTTTPSLSNNLANNNEHDNNKNLDGANYKLSEDRASSIGWYFIKSYYDFFVTKLDEIYKIYHPKASIIHDLFPEDVKFNNEIDGTIDQNGKGPEEIPSVYKANGIEAVKKFFKKYNASSSTNNRIVITSACFQVSMDKNILIVTFGEWSKNNSPFKRFCQTFVLVPGKKENTYDVSNDILRFIESNGFKDISEESPAMVQSSKSQVIDSVDSVSKESSDSTLNLPQADAVEESDNIKESLAQPNNVPPQSILNESNENFDELQKGESELESNEKEPLHNEIKSGDTEEIGNVAEESASERKQVENLEKTENDKEDAKKNSTSKPNQQLTWADLAYQAVPVSTPKSNVAKATSTTATTTTASSSSSTTAKSTGGNAKKSAPQSSSTSSAATNGKFRKEDWFPIYIRGIRQLDEKTLKQHLSKTFGDLKFFKVNQNIALCDFVDQQAQKKALTAKETTLDGITFNLEPRESKTGNNYHNSNVKKFNKDKESSTKDVISNKDKFEKVENKRNANTHGNNTFNSKKSHGSNRKIVKPNNK
ncbi:unnamed protein product [Candida verbasci]|uniref:NTF2 domain-containing protein n=1 Tax=Candida verbasci TaxID=1227364 RepID=A0A9W4U0S4_9ASCO|nr:unnamed protein product [Candida verbasci]